MPNRTTFVGNNPEEALFNRVEQAKLSEKTGLG